MPDILLFILLLLILALGGLLWWQQRTMQQSITSLKDHQTKEHQQLWNQIESWHWLRDRLGLTQGFWLDPIWSASPDFLKLIATHCLEHRPEVILECSSGASTLILAACCRINGRGLVLSLENGEEHAERTQAELKRHGLDAFAKVRHAPLEPREVKGQSWLWYQHGQLPGQVQMLVIDGPPGHLQHLSRYPALPLLRQYLAPGATIFLDDAARPDEQEALRLWLEEYRELSHEYLETVRGCSMLIYVKLAP